MLAIGRGPTAVRGPLVGLRLRPIALGGQLIAAGRLMLAIGRGPIAV